MACRCLTRIALQRTSLCMPRRDLSVFLSLFVLRFANATLFSKVMRLDLYWRQTASCVGCGGNPNGQLSFRKGKRMREKRSYTPQAMQLQQLKNKAEDKSVKRVRQ